MTFRKNPKIRTNWWHSKFDKFLKNKPKKAYYEIKHDNDEIKIVFREEKKRLGGSAEKEEHWYSFLSFKTDTNFAKDLKMFLNDYVEGNAPEVKQRALEEVLDEIEEVFGQSAEDDEKTVQERFKKVKNRILRKKDSEE
jgi:hypothetical protein